MAEGCIRLVMDQRPLLLRSLLLTTRAARRRNAKALILCDINPAALEATRQELSGRGAAVHTYRCDVTSTASVDEVVAQMKVHCPPRPPLRDRRLTHRRSAEGRPEP